MKIYSHTYARIYIFILTEVYMHRHARINTCACVCVCVSLCVCLSITNNMLEKEAFICIQKTGTNFISHLAIHPLSRTRKTHF